MKSRWELILAFLTKVAIGVLLVLALWLPLYIILTAWIVPWLIAGVILGVLLGLYWDKYNPLRLRRLF